MLTVPKIHRSVIAYNWYRSRNQRTPVAVVSMTKTVHGELMNAPQVVIFILYRIAGKFGMEFNLAVWRIDTPTAKLKSAKIKTLRATYASCAVRQILC